MLLRQFNIVASIGKLGLDDSVRYRYLSAYINLFLFYQFSVNRLSHFFDGFVHYSRIDEKEIFINTHIRIFYSTSFPK